MFVITAPPGLNGDEFREMRKRFSQWAPIRGAMRTAFVETQRRYYSAKPIGDMQRLGPEILASKIATVQHASITFGTDNEYAEAYADWREKEGIGPLFLVDDALVTQITNIIAEYVLRGDGGTYKQRKPRYR